MPTSKPVPSKDPSDLLFNAEKLDQAVNGTDPTFVDRLGRTHRTLAALEAEYPAAQANAELSSAQAAESVHAANESIAAKIAAEAARDAINSTGKVFTAAEGTAAGIAATTNGQQFAVVAADLLSYGIYRNNAGAALGPLAVVYTQAYFDSMIRQNQVLTDQDYLLVTDEAGYAGFLASADGRFGTSEAMIGPDGLVATNFEATSEKLAMEGFDLVDSPEGTAFAIADGNGYFAVHVGTGESVGDTSKLQEDVDALKKTGGASSSYGSMPTPKSVAIAHRGSTISGIAPEDSLDAYQFAARAGYEIVETDVQSTSDGQYVMIHDATLNRTYKNKVGYTDIVGDVTVKTSTLATLRSGYVQASANIRHRRPIPTLQEFAATCRDMGVHPLVEYKDTGMSNAECQAIFDILRSYLGEDGFSLTSFYPPQLDFARTLSAKTKLYYIYGGPITSANIDNVAAHAPALLYPDYTVLSDANIAECKSKNVPVACWTVPTNQFDALRKRGIEQFTTDGVAPSLDSQKVLYRNFSDLTFSAYTHTGALADGVVTLAQGQSLTFAKGSLTQVGFGAGYFSFDLKGAAGVVATRMTAAGLSNAGDDFVTYAYQALMKDDGFALTITAGVGGCLIKDVRIAVASFD